MSETLLTPSSVKLYGRLLNDLQYNYDATTVTIGSNNFLQQQLFSAFGAAKGPVTCFARIYAFSFEGALYSLPKPSIFLVHGGGTPVVGQPRSSMDMAGVAAKEWEFSDNLKSKAPYNDLVYWEYEKGDFSLRLDTEAGPLEQILLTAAVRGADMADRSGANLGVRSGANLSGANVSGANVSGANVSGANLRNR